VKKEKPKTFGEDKSFKLKNPTVRRYVHTIKAGETRFVSQQI